MQCHKDPEKQHKSITDYNLWAALPRVGLKDWEFGHHWPVV